MQVEQQTENNSGKYKREKKKKTKKREVIKNRKVGRWFLGETLGKGGYSWVKKGYDRKDGRVVALKFTSKAKADWNENQSKQIQNEIEALRQIKHKNVLQLLAYNLNAKYPQKDAVIIPSVLLVLEYLPGGELFDILYYTQQLNENVARTYFIQLMDGMEACHKAGICHRDIKPQNLLLDAAFQLKIADFGLAKVFEKDVDALMRTFYVGTRGYQAPEILKKEEYSLPCDIFSCGVVLFILLAGYPPFEAASTKCRWYAPLAAGNAREFWKQHRGCQIPGKAKDLITRMLWYDQKKRINMSRIRKHKWFQGKSLSASNLGKELKQLHKLMEIKRRQDADKQSQLEHSIKRSGFKTIQIHDNSNEHDETKIAEIMSATMHATNLKYAINVTSIIEQQIWDGENQQISQNNLCSQVVKLLNNKEIADKVNSSKDKFIQLFYSDQAVECSAPPLPENEAITLKDVFTEQKPRYVLHYIQDAVKEFGGETKLDLQNASLEANLATHNFPAPVTIGVRIFYHETENCHLVKFERIAGDALHFARVLRNLVQQCGFALTGSPQFKWTNEESEKAKQLPRLNNGVGITM